MCARTEGAVEANHRHPRAAGAGQLARRHDGVGRRAEPHVPHHEPVPAAAAAAAGGGGAVRTGALRHAELGDVEAERLGLGSDAGMEGLADDLPSSKVRARAGVRACCSAALQCMDNYAVGSFMRIMRIGRPHRRK